jgi:hypothetical protein
VSDASEVVVTLTEAVRLTGRDRSTLARAASRGELEGARRDGDGPTAPWVVPVTSLEARYGPLAPAPSVPASSTTSSDPNAGTAVIPYRDLAPLLERLGNAEREAVEHRYALEAERERSRVALERATAPARSTVPAIVSGLALAAYATALATLDLDAAYAAAVPAAASVLAITWGAYASRRT